MEVSENFVVTFRGAFGGRDYLNCQIRGARDGESMPLTESLAKRLAVGNAGY